MILRHLYQIKINWTFGWDRLIHVFARQPGTIDIFLMKLPLTQKVQQSSNLEIYAKRSQ